MSALLLVLLLAVIAGIALVAAGHGDALGGEGTHRGPLAELPPRPAASDVDALRFSLGLRGYRMDEVDRVLDHLRDELAARDLRIAELEAHLASSMSEEALYDEGADYSPDAYVEDAAYDEGSYGERADKAVPRRESGGDRVAMRPTEKG